MEQNLLPLKPYHLPPEPSLWPLAPGWWGLLLIALLSMAIGIYLYKKHLQKARCNYRPEANQLLQQIMDNFSSNSNVQILAMSINTLLKRIALSAINQKAARLADTAWLNFLDAQLPTEKKLGNENTFIFLTQQPYSQQVLLDEAQLTQCLNNIQYWIDNHRGELCNVKL